MESRPYVASPTIVNPIVTLNVGGTKYTTTIQTLTTNPHTLFASLLRTLPRDKDGDIFIDRDPIYFRYILDSLRQAEIQHPYATDTYDYIRLWKEIDFFRLLAPGHIWGFSRKKKLRHGTLQVSEDTFSVSKIAKSKPSISSVCGNKALNSGKYRWRVITNGITGGITFGIVHIDAFKLRKLKSSDVYGLSTSGHTYNLERYGVIDNDEEDIAEPVNLSDPISLMKNEEELGKRVRLKDESPSEEDETGKENETSSVDAKEDSEDGSDEELSPKRVKFTDDSSRGSGGKVVHRIRKEDKYLMEYETASGIVKVYKQDDELWYTGKVAAAKEGYYFFTTMKDLGDVVKIEILE